MSLSGVGGSGGGSGGFDFYDTAGGDPGELMPRAITCVDCGGRAHLMTIVTEEQPLLAGQVATYRCADCRDRWDIVVPGGPDDDEDEADERGW